jgi:hypothetical protein
MNKDVFTILRKRYPEREYALMEEVSDRAGFGRSRSADYIIMNLWPSRGLSLHGIELKSYRSDWLNELKKPEKAENIFQYCDYFWLLTTEESIAKENEIPEKWGWMNIKGGKIFTIKEAPKLTPKPISRDFLACLLKRSSDKSGYIRTSEIQDKIKDAKEQAKEESDRQANYKANKYDELKNILEEYKTASGIDLINRDWRSTVKDIGSTVRFIQSGGTESIRNQLLQLENTAKNVLERISKSLSVINNKNEP